MTANAIRQLMCRKRRQIGCGAQQAAAFRLSRQIQASRFYQRSQHIACYWAVNGEIDLRFLIKKAWKQGKSCYLPVIRGEHMSFKRYLPGMRLQKNRFGIPEPVAGQAIATHSLDLVLTPLAAFDKHGHRIGMGGGYYDRTFSPQAIAANAYYQSAVLVGVAHRCQQVSVIVPEPWDVPMASVVTD